MIISKGRRYKKPIQTCLVTLICFACLSSNLNGECLNLRITLSVIVYTYQCNLISQILNSHSLHVNELNSGGRKGISFRIHAGAVLTPFSS